MESRTFCAIQHFKIEKIDKPYTINDAELRQDEKLNRSIFDIDFLHQVGTIKIQHYFVNRPYFFHTEELDAPLNENVWIKTLLSRKTIYNQLINYLWFLKDNSSSVSDVIAYVPSIAGKIYQIGHGAGFSKADGTFQTTVFTVDDLHTATKIYCAIAGLQQDEKINRPEIKTTKDPAVIDSAYHYRNHSKTNRIERALSFLFMARATSFLPLKISLYISVLESLFTTDVGEIVHKISERLSLYIGGDYENRIDLYKFMKQAYGVRSKFFHGQKQDKGKGETKSLQDCAIELDSILRVTLTNVIVNDSQLFTTKTDDLLNDFFNKLIFGKQELG